MSDERDTYKYHWKEGNKILGFLAQTAGNLH